MRRGTLQSSQVVTSAAGLRLETGTRSAKPFLGYRIGRNYRRTTGRAYARAGAA